MVRNVARTLFALALAASTGAASAAGAGEVRTVTIKATEYEFEPSRIEAEPGETLRLELANEGRIAHSLKLARPELETETIQPSQSDAVEFTMPDGEVEFHCTVPGHEPAGMKGTIVPK